MIDTLFASKQVDILLFAEGTYPFVKGGVSTWIFEMIKNLAEYRFGIIFLGAYEGLYDEPLYPLPENLVHLQIVYLFQSENQDDIPHKNKIHKKTLHDIKRMHDIFKNSHELPIGLSDSIGDIGEMIERGKGFDYFQFLHSEEAWQYISEQYCNYSTDPAFIDYFWNIRNMHAPLWRMEEVIPQVPMAGILHTISTGYAGMLAAMVHQRYGFPLILSEHGLYSKERNIELLQTTMFSKVDRLLANVKTFNYQHRLWLNFYNTLARICYHNANPIISLFENASIQQQAAGADSNKTRVIPNGIDIPKFASVRRPPGTPVPKIVCYVGRVVRIKDIKTFIRSVAIMATKDKDIIAWIKTAGSDDPDYKQECLDYIALMGLENKIKIVMEGDMLDVLAQIGVLVLSSISEGMPLVLLESMAAGIPVIATSVGACREIIEGRDEEDKALGKCGSVVSIVNASMLADEVVNLLNNPDLWLQMREVCIKRAEKYYNQTDMLSSYRKIYNTAMGIWQE
ncbi:GT4 family glycosyltransferase PelF [Legionella spiritensis]|uniref:CapM protein, capsular polysaccharide biosynthesis n=1 Tax=Legionella spiritensis TaxID=452 RepID=A0A0W0YXP2_LEGSP|nr:GT4 family glycosyltransferase PelF [Legionella spiritensis]KTD61685.1 CapM protein, capsular polysaccharide biosynthesis [Legionella spiritensis]SNV38949.1 D-inositol-3-phosphate glycosyltransferase [Legionella spiritensis]